MAKKQEALAKKKDMITVYGTGNNKNIPFGQAHLLHEVHAENLVAKGFAQYEKPSDEDIESAGAVGKSKSRGKKDQKPTE